MEHNKIPLTLEQLYQMEGEPVWVVSLSQKGEKTVHQDWFIVVIEDLRLTVKRPLKFGYYICGADTYGKTWLAYAQKLHEDLLKRADNAEEKVNELHKVASNENERDEWLSFYEIIHQKKKALQSSKEQLEKILSMFERKISGAEYEIRF